MIGLGPHDVTEFELIWSNVGSEDAQPAPCDGLSAADLCQCLSVVEYVIGAIFLAGQVELHS